MIDRARATALVLLVAAAWAVQMAILERVPSSGELWAFVSVPPVVVGGVYLYDKWLWAWPLLRQVLAKQPDLRGMWRVSLRSSYTTPDGKTVAPIGGWIAIRQTASWLSVRLYTSESSSMSAAAQISRSPDGVCHLAAVYSNRPNAAVRDRSPIHHGGFVLDVDHAQVPMKMTGNYWTDRLTRGDMDLVHRSRKIYASFAETEAALGS